MKKIPFVVGQWVRGPRFYGRCSLIDEVLEGPRNWLWLLGTRRIGKTSLLKQLEHLTTNGESSTYFPLFWDLQGADDSDELHHSFLDALLDAEERLEPLGIDAEEMEGQDLFRSLNRLRRQIRGAGRKLLLLCDEVEELIKLQRKDPGILRKLRRALQSQEDIRSVLASTTRLWALADLRDDTSPFLHGFAPPLFINRLGNDEAAALIRQDQLPETSRPSLTADTVSTIATRCDNHPYLMQLVSKRYLELGDLSEAIEHVAADPMVSYFFSVDFEMLSPNERDVVRVVADMSASNSNSIQARIGLEQDGLNSALQRLEDLGYLRRNDERRFELVNFFFRRWLGAQPLPPVKDGRQITSLDTDDPSEEPGGPSLGVFDSRYELLRRAGEGASGVVYEAHDRELDCHIAIKILRASYCDQPDVLARFRQEIRLARGLVHSNIATVYHLGECDGRRYLTMKWIGGPTLAQVISREGALPVDRAFELAIAIASALEVAHRSDVIHRDIKPQNIMLDERGRPYLADFGLARLIDAPAITRTGLFVGTPDYASPEQADLLPLDARSDVYSLGVVLYQMVTGDKPFVADSISEILELHRNTPAPTPRGRRPELPDVLESVVLRCLEKKPEKRFADAGELRRRLEEIR